MSKRLEKWLAAVAEDADAHLALSWIERLRRSIRYLRTGRSKVTQKTLSQFGDWRASQSIAPEPVSAEPSGAAETTPPDRLKADKSLASIRLVIADLRGGDALRHTLDSLPLEAFHSHAVISPPAGGRLFDLFPLLDASLREDSGAEAVLVLESGAILTAAPVALPEDCDAAFPRWRTDDGSLTSALLDAQSLLREPLAPMSFPVVLLRRGVTMDFEACWHYAAWDLLLRLIEQGSGRADFPESVSVVFSPHGYALSQLDRHHLKRHDPDVLARLPDASDEWSVTRHDLVTRIVQRHPEYFRDNAAYLAAIAAATRGC